MGFDVDKALAAEIGSYDRSEWSGEIGGQSVTLYAPPISPRDIEMVARHQPDFATNPRPSGMARLILMKAQDENGAKVFSVNKHMPLFERMSANKIGEIFGDLFGEAFSADADEELEDRAKK